MAIVVQKYGGTSVGSIEKIKEVAKKVAAAKDRGDDLVVVVSAMAGETDNLIGMAYEIMEAPPDREMDVLLSSGERRTSALMSMALASLGYQAQSFSGRQVGMETDTSHTRARIQRVSTERVRKALEEGKIAVVAGFQGINANGDVTTLGRGGSDTTAVALAAAMGARVCEIYTDVDGVYSADPNVVPSARKLDRISYEEMLEMASMGAKVLHNRSVELAMKYEVPILVKSTFREGSGTLVTKDEEMERVVVSSVACDKNQAKVTITRVVDRPGIAAKIFSKVAQAGVVIDMIIQNVSEGGYTDMSFTMPRTDVARTRQAVEEILREVGGEEVRVDEDIAKVSIVGAGMAAHSGVAATMFEALSRENINIMMISTSEIKISCIIERKYAELATSVLHDAYGLGEAG